VSRGLKALALVAVVVVAVVVAFRFVGNDSAPDPAAPSPTRSAATVQPFPDDMPDVGSYVVSRVNADGEVHVQTWIRSATPISELDLTTTDPDLAPGGVESLGVVARSMSDKVLARRDSVGTNTQKLRLREPVTELYLTYEIDGAMSDASETVQGRSLARVLSMDLRYDGESGPSQRVVTGPGTVINVACLTVKDDSDFNATPRPCGAATADGGWAVTLTGAARTDRLLASLGA
jgi:hypothetical protein